MNLDKNYKLDVERSLIENSDYLKQLAKEIDGKNIDEIDSNLAYEIAYASTYLDNIMLGVSENQLTEDMKEVKNILDCVLEELPYEKLNEIKSNKEYKKLLRLRYDDVTDASFEKSYKVGAENVVKTYIKSRIPSLLFIGIGIYFSINAPQIVDLITSFLGFSESKTSNSTNEMVFSSISNIVYHLTGLIILMIINAILIYICLDIAYLMLPKFRELLKNRKEQFISTEAIKSVEYCMGDFVSYRKVKSFERVERNKVWLDTMLKDLMFRKNKTSKLCDLEKEMKILKLNIKRMEVSNNKGRDYYLSMSKIEFLRSKYLELCEV